jgi:hypothetical protein
MAAILRVKPDAPGPAHDGSTWQTAYTGVPFALAAAATGDEIWVAAGTYNYGPALMLRDGISLYGGFAGGETAREQRDPGAHTATLTVPSEVGSAIVAPPSVTRATVVDGFTIVGGRGTLRSGAYYGSGVYCDGSSPTLSHNVFDRCAAGAGTVAGYGGGVASVGGSPLLSENTFQRNSVVVTGTQGSGSGAALIGGTPVVTGNTFFINTGPALYCAADAQVTGNDITTTLTSGTAYGVGIVTRDASPRIETNTVSGNPAGGIQVNGGAPEIVGNTISVNGGLNGNPSLGAGVDVRSANALISANVIDHNVCAFYAGGIAVTLSGSPSLAFKTTIEGNVIRNNTSAAYGMAADGAAILATCGVDIRDNEIRNNEGVRGGAVRVASAQWPPAEYHIVNNRITDNKATLGESALAIDGRMDYQVLVEVAGNEIARNTGLDAVYLSAPNVTVAENRIQDNGLGINHAALFVEAAQAVVRDNLVTGNTASAGVYLVWLEAPTDFCNNTIADNDAGRALYTSLSGSTVVNNVIAFNAAGVDGDNTNPVMRTNLVYGNGPYNFRAMPDPTGADGNISTDPLFVDRAAGDYHLAEASPALDTGTDYVVQQDERDADGRYRILGAHVDIGAYESAEHHPGILADAIRALRLAAGLDIATPDDVADLDVETSGMVDIKDATRLMRRAVGLDTP